MSSHPCVPRWMPISLILAGIYNLLWGTITVLFPHAFFRLIDMQPPLYPQIWQCVGMIVGVYGIGFLIAARDPLRHWPIVLVALLGKIFGPIGFLLAVFQDELPWSWGITILTNDLIWWIPFTGILYASFRFHADTTGGGDPIDLSTALSQFKNQQGATLGELSLGQPLLVLFFRHSGCTFCREAMARLAEHRKEIEAQGVKIALVHMSPPQNAAQTFARYGLEDLHCFSDPQCQLYRAFELRRGSFGNLFGPQSWWRGAVAGIIRRHGLGLPVGDGFRMHGAFLLQDGRILQSFRAQNASDQPDLVSLSCIPNSQAADATCSYAADAPQESAVESAEGST